MFQKLAVDEGYYQRQLEAKIGECIKIQHPWVNFSVIGFICAGKNYFCVQAIHQNKKVFNSDLEEMLDFCPDSIRGCSNCTKPHIFEPQDIPALEQQIRENLARILKSGNIQPKKGSYDELVELAENYVLVKLPHLEYLGGHVEQNSEAEYYYVKFIVKTALVCMRILDYIKYGIKVVASKPYEEELVEYKGKMKEILLWQNPKNIYELNISKRVKLLLLRENILTVQELREITEETLLRIKGIGDKSMKEIVEIKELLLP